MDGCLRWSTGPFPKFNQLKQKIRFMPISIILIISSQYLDDISIFIDRDIWIPFVVSRGWILLPLTLFEHKSWFVHKAELLASVQLMEMSVHLFFHNALKQQNSPESWGISTHTDSYRHFGSWFVSFEYFYRAGFHNNEPKTFLQQKYSIVTVSILWVLRFLLWPI